MDISTLSAGDQKALVKLIAAARIVNIIFMQQFWSHDLATYQKLRHDRTPLGAEQTHYFVINKGPWSEIDEYTALFPMSPRENPRARIFIPKT